MNAWVFLQLLDLLFMASGALVSNMFGQGYFQRCVWVPMALQTVWQGEMFPIGMTSLAAGNYVSFGWRVAFVTINAGYFSVVGLAVFFVFMDDIDVALWTVFNRKDCGCFGMG